MYWGTGAYLQLQLGRKLLQDFSIWSIKDSGIWTHFLFLLFDFFEMVLLKKNCIFLIGNISQQLQWVAYANRAIYAWNNSVESPQSPIIFVCYLHFSAFL